MMMKLLLKGLSCCTRFSSGFTDVPRARAAREGGRRPYLPHRPYLSTAHHDPFRATNVTSKLHPALPGGFLTSSGLSVLLLFQNHHNTHHLHPFLPFYRAKGD